jgi:hypothetical protein
MIEAGGRETLKLGTWRNVDRFPARGRLPLVHPQSASARGMRPEPLALYGEPRRQALQPAPSPAHIEKLGGLGL